MVVEWERPKRATHGELEHALDTTVKDFSLDGKPAVEGLLGLAYEYRLPMGIEYMDVNLVHKPVKVHLRNVTVREAIEMLLKPLREYRVSFSEGLVEVYSPGARRDRSNILNISIEHFEVSRVDALQASTNLQGEIFAKLHPGVGFGGDTPYGQTAPSEPRVTLSLDHLKVYEILDAIVAKDGAAMWLVVVPPAGLSFFEWNRWAIYNFNPVGKDSIIHSLEEVFPPNSR